MPKSHSTRWLLVTALAASAATLAFLAVSSSDAAPALAQGASEGDGYDCDPPYTLPVDLGPPKASDATQQDADSFAWRSFLALNIISGGPAWADWHSTVDLIECNADTAPDGGTCTSEGFYYPTECTGIEDYASFRVIDQVGKVDDDFLEATTQGLSHDPVIASNGTFLRYDILISPSTYDWIVQNGLQQESTLDQWNQAGKPVVFPCPTSGTPDISTVLKIAWLDLSNPPPGLSASDYYSQEVLVYTPGYLNSDGQATCVKKAMGMVGQHLVRKTLTQPAWVWATFEHRSNAPDCTGLPGEGDHAGDDGPNTACPSSVSASYSLFSTASSPPSATSTPSASCNTPPAENAPGQCKNPETGQGGWCLDKPPVELSHLCRQVGPGNYYSGATSWDGTPPNRACQSTGPVWMNYQLITTQWDGQDLDSSGCTQNVVANGQFGDTHDGTVPTVAIGPGGSARPFLANTTAESYERANCMGCHSKSTVEETKGNVSTDFIYFLGIEVPEGPVPSSVVGSRDGE